MDFELSKAQKDIQKAARKFAKGEFPREVVEELLRVHAFPIGLCQKAGELGFIGLHFPEEYGGQGYGCLENVLVIEEFCRRDSSVGAALLLCAFASENILRSGTEEQKLRYLRPITEGKEFFGGAITEPDHGSDITQMATTTATWLTSTSNASTATPRSRRSTKAPRRSRRTRSRALSLENSNVREHGTLTEMNHPTRGRFFLSSVNLEGYILPMDSHAPEK